MKTEDDIKAEIENCRQQILELKEKSRKALFLTPTQSDFATFEKCNKEILSIIMRAGTLMWVLGIEAGDDWFD